MERHQFQDQGPAADLRATCVDTLDGEDQVSLHGFTRSAGLDISGTTSSRYCAWPITPDMKAPQRPVLATGTVHFEGRDISFADITVPVLSFGGASDTIAPVSCVRPIEDLVPDVRFEVVVRDNDRNRIPSQGDSFAITLSSATAVTSELDPATVIYARAGRLSSGNLTVD